MEMIKVIVEEPDYDVEFCVYELCEVLDTQRNYSVDDSVEVDKAMYDEWLNLTNRLDELEYYFCDFRSVNQNIEWEEHVARVAKEKAYLEKMQAIALESSLSDRGYVKAQEEIKRGYTNGN